MKEVLEDLGVAVDFWRVRIRPGSPFSFGRAGRPAVFGLPGNPVSALVTFEVLVRPALRRLLGRDPVHNPLIRVRAEEPIPSKPGLVHFLRVRLGPAEPGELPAAKLTGPQGSGILRSMSEADAILIVPEDAHNTTG
jgi:molybdopterin molybdotransferase